MIAAIALLAVLGARAPGEVVAHLHTEPAAVEVGEPCRFVLEVEHAAGATVKFPEGDLVPDDSWALLEPRKVTRPTPTRTVASWTCLSLEAGERQLPAIRIDVGDADGVRKVDVDAGLLRVRPALAEGEDAPRPMRGFRAAPEGSGSRGRLVLVAAAALVALLAGVYFWRRARRKSLPAPAPTALDRLAELQRIAAEDEEAARRVVYALSRLLRGSVDAFVREDRAALVDADWAARIEPDERVPLGVRRGVARILRDSERIKYALHAPTRFALTEMLADARNALEALSAAPIPIAAPAKEEAA